MRVFLIFISVLVLEALAFVNAFIMNLKGATVDAERFLNGAREWVRVGHLELTFDAGFYEQFLGTLFYAFWDSEFLVAQTNIVALVVACQVFHRINELLVGRSSAYLTIPFMLWPSMLTRSTTAMREPLLILSAVLVVFFFLRYARGGKAVDLVSCLGALALGALFHKAYAVAFVAFGGAAVLLSAWVRARRFRVVDVGRRITLLLVLAAAVGLVIQRAGNSRGLMPLVAALTSDTEQIQQIIDYKRGRAFRTTYDASINVSSPVALIASLPKNWMYYNLMPFPWQVRNALDVYATIEAGFRFMGFVMLGLLLAHYPAQRRVLLTVALFHIALMAVWAAGTTNYGTASRHHLTTNWAFLVYFWCYVNRGVWSEGHRGRHRITQGGDYLALRELPQGS
jgi:hypothetical protein